MVPSLFLVGTGYIGGTILDALLSRRKGEFEISALTRNKDQAKILEDLGVRPVFGTLDDSDVIENEARKSDVIIHVATADHLPSAEAIISGIRKREPKTTPVVYIHTSGTGVLLDNADGRFASSKIYSDLRPEDIDALDPKAPHREVDLAVSAAARDASLKNARIGIILPPLIYGVGTGPFNKLSIQSPALIRSAIKRGYVGQIGEGKPIWNNVHIADLANAYLVLIDAYMKEDLQANPEHNKSVYFFAESGENSWRSLSETFGQVLHSKGVIPDPEPRPLTDDVMNDDLFGVEVAKATFGGNSRAKGDRLRLLGWKPEVVEGYGTKVTRDLEREVDEILKERKAREG